MEWKDVLDSRLLAYSYTRSKFDFLVDFKT